MHINKCSVVALVAAISTLAVEPVASFRSNSVVAASLVRNLENGDSVFVRGGAAAVDVDEEDFSEIESSEEEDEVEEEVDPKLAKSALSAASKAKAKAKTAAKAAVSSTLQATAAPKKTKKSGIMKLFTIPYIIKACLNPVVFIQMTKGYWASLVNLDYLKNNVVSYCSFCNQVGAINLLLVSRFLTLGAP